ncbi:hypothetical protein D3C73_209380 [compost metagenome]
MYQLFNTESRIKQTNIATFGLDYVKRELMNVQVNRYKQLRALNPGYLKSDHLLQKILGMIDIPFDGDLPDYYLRVSSIVDRLAGQMGFCTAGHHGRVRNHSHFYGKGVNEVIIAIADDEVTPAQIWFNWRNMSPVRVLSHPIMGCGIIELDGTNDIKGLPYGATAVIEINIPLLACQYHLWRVAVRGLAPEGFAFPVSHFLTQIVIPNLLPSHLDVAVGNTLHSLIGGQGYVKVESDMPFYTADLYPRLEKGLQELATRFCNQTLYYRDILSNVPVFGNDTLLQTVRMPDIAYTNQAIWALTMARLPVVAMLLKFDQLAKNVKNDADRNRIRRSLSEADSGKYLTNQIPSDVAAGIANFIATNVTPLLNTSPQAAEQTL